MMMYVGRLHPTDEPTDGVDEADGVGTTISSNVISWPFAIGVRAMPRRRRSGR